jgi:hypothetical protein
MKQHGNFPVKTTLDKAALENDTADHNASHLAARHETAALTAAGKRLVHSAISGTSSVTLTAALWVSPELQHRWQHCPRKSC